MSMNETLTRASIKAALGELEQVLDKFPEHDVRHGLCLGVGTGLELAGKLLDSAYEDEHKTLVKTVIDHFNNM